MRAATLAFLFFVMSGRSLGANPASTDSVALAAPNVVVINSRLVTSGQPNAEALAGLMARGFSAVIYLVPPTVDDAVRDEAVIVARQGLLYVNIPIKFDQPTERDYQTFAAVLSALLPLTTGKILVHCQVNLRASSMVFLYRAIVEKEDPRVAYEALAKVWSPRGAWKPLISDTLRKHGVKFELY